MLHAIHRLVLARARLPLALAALLAASACAKPGAVRPARIAVEESGFTISEELRVGAGTRSDFEDAVGLLEQERYEEGIALLREVTEEAPHATAAHIDLAIAYAAVDDLAAAEASLQRALALNPRHPVANNELGIVYRRTGRFEQARASYEEALDVFPEFHFARKNLAILCDLYLGDAECALENYERYARAVPDDEAVAMWIADLRNRTGR